MRIQDVLKEHHTAISFEFFPPRTEEGSKELLHTIQGLIPLHPAYVSVTYGAGGGTRSLTHALVQRIHQENALTVVPHLTCVDQTRDEIHTILKNYSEAGIENVMCLRGDPSKGKNVFEPVPNGFRYAAELVTHIKKNFPHFGIGVAGFPEGHPETPNRLKEMEYLKAKVDAGADYICTQLFFDNRDFYDFVERCELAGIRVPIIAGLMPITSLKSMQRMSELALGARYPAKLMRALERARESQDDSYIEKVGIHWASEQARDLIDHHVKGIHFYTLNKSHSTLEIFNSLGLKNAGLLKSSLFGAGSGR